MYVCICNGVTEHDIRQAARSGCGGIAELTMRTGCGACCGSCVPMATEILAAVRDEIPDSGYDNVVAFPRISSAA